MAAQNEKRYQVFVSSTFSDLREERQKVLEALLEMQMFPAGMELFPSADDEQWEFIKREIESSDYYVVIVAGRYGSIAPSGLSYTEMEYDHEVSLAKPVMGFLHADPSQIPLQHSEKDPGNQEKLRLFREKVKARRLVKFYRSSDDLHGQVWQALSHAVKMQPRVGWVRGDTARRQDDLEEINILQKKVRELIDENAALREAGVEQMRQISKGAETIELEVFPVAFARTYGAPRSPGNKVVKAEPPDGSFLMRTTWDELFLAVFGRVEGRVAEWDLVLRIGGLLVRIGVRDHMFPEGPWTDLIQESLESGPPQLAWDRKGIEAILQKIGIQFEGLGLMRVVNETRTSSFGDRVSYSRNDVWQLTERGLQHRLLLAGVRRTEA